MKCLLSRGQALPAPLWIPLSCVEGESSDVGAII